MKVTFHGATDTVTGSRFLFEQGRHRWLVDCGLYQGSRELSARNRDPLPFDPVDLDAVFLTHAHIDHSGFLPGLIRAGYRGPILATPGTIDLCEILLRDSARLQEEHFHYLERKNMATSADSPLYSSEDAETTLKAMQPCAFDEPIESISGLTAHFRPAGHILGAASLYMEAGGTRVCVSGDLGRSEDPVMRPPEPFAGADFLLVESTYGGRLHEGPTPARQLEDALAPTLEQGGTIIIPAFAVGRAQSLLHLISEAFEARRLPGVPVFLDSPMAINASRIYCQHSSEHRLSNEQCDSACGVAHYTRSVEASRAISRTPGAKIVVAASGMATGGRVLHHLKRYLPHAGNRVVIAGYQAPGTLGAALESGLESVEILGRSIAVRADVRSITGLSAHADQAELAAWLQASPTAPNRVFLVHGEHAERTMFAKHVGHTLGWDAHCPEPGESAELE